MNKKWDGIPEQKMTDLRPRLIALVFIILIYFVGGVTGINKNTIYHDARNVFGQEMITDFAVVDKAMVIIEIQAHIDDENSEDMKGMLELIRSFYHHVGSRHGIRKNIDQIQLKVLNEKSDLIITSSISCDQAKKTDWWKMPTYGHIIQEANVTIY